MRKQFHKMQTEQLPKQQAIEVLKELQEVSCYLNDGKFPDKSTFLAVMLRINNAFSKEIQERMARQEQVVGIVNNKYNKLMLSYQQNKKVLEYLSSRASGFKSLSDVIETAIEILHTEKDNSPAMSFILAAFNQPTH